MSSRPRKYINKLNIIEYWKNKIDECELNFDWSDAHEVCWACGDNVETEKCHIIPHCFDGDEIPENMILLCNQCHKENPNAISYDSYIQWLKSRKKIADKAFGVYWSGRAMIEYKNIYGSDFDVDLKT